MSERREELLINAIAALLEGVNHVAVGAISPIAGAAALLARARSGGAMRVSMLGSARHNFFTEGGRELFDCAAQGRIDAFFLGGAQIDGSANINLVGIGGYPQSEARFAGSFGSAHLYFVVPRVILLATGALHAHAGLASRLHQRPRGKRTRRLSSRRARRARDGTLRLSLRSRRGSFLAR